MASFDTTEIEEKFVADEKELEDLAIAARKQIEGGMALVARLGLRETNGQHIITNTIAGLTQISEPHDFDISYARIQYDRVMKALGTYITGLHESEGFLAFERRTEEVPFPFTYGDKFKLKSSRDYALHAPRLFSLGLIGKGDGQSQ